MKRLQIFVTEIAQFEQEIFNKRMAVMRRNVRSTRERKQQEKKDKAQRIDSAAPTGAMAAIQALTPLGNNAPPPKSNKDMAR